MLPPASLDLSSTVSAVLLDEEEEEEPEEEWHYRSMADQLAEVGMSMRDFL